MFPNHLTFLMFLFLGKHVQLQKNVIMTHAVGAGEAFPAEVGRGMLKKRNAGRCYQACSLYFPIQA